MLIPVTDADGILLDLRYASVDNLLGRAICARAGALLRRPARDALLRAAARAGALGLALKLYDAFRPLEAQWMVWRAAPDKTVLADPRTGSTHPRAIAVELALVDAATGLDLPISSGYDGLRVEHHGPNGGTITCRGGTLIRPFGRPTCPAARDAPEGRGVEGPSLTSRAGTAALLATAAAVTLAGCARDAEPATFAVPRAAAAEIRMVCPPGTFIGTMTVNCPQPLTRAALAR